MPPASQAPRHGPLYEAIARSALPEWHHGVPMPRDQYDRRRAEQQAVLAEQRQRHIASAEQYRGRIDVPEAEWTSQHHAQYQQLLARQRHGMYRKIVGAHAELGLLNEPLQTSDEEPILGIPVRMLAQFDRLGMSAADQQSVKSLAHEQHLVIKHGDAEPECAQR